MFLSYRAKTRKHGNAHTDSDEYSIVTFCKNATIKMTEKICQHQQENTKLSKAASGVQVISKYSLTNRKTIGWEWIF